MCFRVPKAGSAYIYSYVTMGEGLALIIGWNLILEYAIGTASVARGYAGYLDEMLGHKMYGAFRETFPMNIPHLSPFPDFCAFFITVFLAVILSLGVKLSAVVNKLFTCLNLCVVLVVSVIGFSNADVKNWQIGNQTIEDYTVGNGGFFPFGISGTLAGAATCFYGFVGFDGIATSGEEALNPHRTIPMSILYSLTIVCVAYVSVSSSVTLLVPYYMQDVTAPLPAAFRTAGMPWAAHLVGIGALFGLSTSLLGAMFPLPRIIYAMASDGILFRWLATVNEKLQTPLYATVVSGVFIATIAAVFELSSLVDMMSIGTLMAYTMVALCVLMLRYQNSPGNLGDYMAMSEKQSLTKSINGKSYYQTQLKNGHSADFEVEDEPDSSEEELIYCNEDNLDLIARNRKVKLMKENSRHISISFKSFLAQMFNLPRLETPNPTSSYVAKTMSLMAAKFAVSLAAIIIFGLEKGHGLNEDGSLKPVWIFPLVFMPVMMTLSLISVSLQPVSEEVLNFKVPLVPFLPVLSIFLNTYLMMKLSAVTWIRFAIWMLIGFVIYGFYGWQNSSEEYRQHGQIPPDEVTRVNGIRK